MMETIVVYFTPLASTRIIAYVGLGLAHHMAIVYTNSAGQSFGASSGPSIQSTLQTPQNAISALNSLDKNEPSDFGTLMSDPHNNTPFEKGRMNDYYTQDFQGKEFPHETVLEGLDLSAQWQTIVKMYAAIGQMDLTYSPTSQNSNSMAGEALRRSGLRVPFSSNARFAPAVFTRLPAYHCELQHDCRKK